MRMRISREKLRVFDKQMWVCGNKVRVCGEKMRICGKEVRVCGEKMRICVALGQKTFEHLSKCSNVRKVVWGYEVDMVYGGMRRICVWVYEADMARDCVGCECLV